MASVDNGHPAETERQGPGGRRGRGRRVAAALTLVGVLLAGASLLRDYFDLRWHSSAVDGTPGPVGPARSSSADPTGTPGMTGAPTSPAGDGIGLDTLAVEQGGANIVALPRALRGQAGYDRALTISCPRNTAADKHREVVYPLRRRYFDLATIVRPYFPDDPRAAAYVSVLIAVRQSDGTVNRLERGGREARQDAPASLSADVEGADELALRVQCESPTGVVVLTNARLIAQ
ncbi:hypothetical protein [Micromonospora sp. NPDC092111]|uniref:hypothetical protein n=1 Tax=Micromonospora sp. NPDC092111 TaxID=3364289 RepID=UPI0038155F47